MPAKKKPSYTLHAATGQGRCRIAGKDHYFGPYNSPASREKYEELVAEWFARNGDTSRITLTIDDLCIQFMEFAARYYRRKDGEPTGSTANFRHALRPLIRLFGKTRIREFGPLKLVAVRDEMVKAGLCRTNINREIHRIKRVFRWGVESELVPAPIYQALAAVASLKMGRSDAVESERVEPVAEAVVNATLPHLPKVVAAMVKLQLLSGARPGEICLLRPCDVTMQTNGVWSYRPEHHKTEHHGKQRRIFIGPEGQAVLRPYLARDAEAYCFSPAESEAERNADRRANRKSPMTPSQAARQAKQKPQRAPSDRYAKDAYNRAIVRACRLAGVEPWSPNQLRHTRATAIREKYGLEAASTVLGHSDPRVTEIYAERDFEMAARIMSEVG
ncbi:MAG: tyrosine-type recombinase/integrase [Planctomycetaceae bacterium]